MLLFDYDKSLRNCNADKRALREWAKQPNSSP
jgi:hypothetical protein